MKYNWKKVLVKVEVISTPHTVDKLLGVQEIPTGTGLEISSNVYEVIDN